MAPPTSDESGDRTIADRLRNVRRRLDELGGSDVTIIAVTKGFGIEAVHEVMQAGCRIVGENYAQELLGKFGSMAADERPDIHFIGHLQSNKVAALAPLVAVWQTVDRPSIAAAVARRAPGAKVMIQVNATGETGKDGCRIEDTAALVAQARQGGLEVIGLMTIGPSSGDREVTKRAFSQVSRLRDELGLAELSMGMSEDLDLAVPLGSTMVRLGRALFGERPPQNGI